MNDVRIYQINTERDEDNLTFRSYDYLSQHDMNVRSDLYDLVFKGKLDCDGLEDIYKQFNTDPPEGYKGHSLSVSDIVQVLPCEDESGTIIIIDDEHSEEMLFTVWNDFVSAQEELREQGVTFDTVNNFDGPKIKPGFYYCDFVGFKEVDFDPLEAEEMKESKIRVVYCEPGKAARIAEISNELEGLQSAVNGYIEAFYPFEEAVCIICNDEGKINGMDPCRAVYGQDNKIMDIVFGPFLICDCSGENFGSLNAEQLQRFYDQFRYPEQFFRINGEIEAVKYRPEKDDMER